MDIGWQALRLKIVLASFPLVLQLKSWILNRWGKKIGKVKANPSQLTELTLPQSIMATIFEGQMLNATCLLWTLFKLVVAVWKNVYLHFLIYIYIHTLYYFLFIYIYIYLCVFLNMNRVCYVTEVAPSTRFRQLSDTWRNCSSFAASKGRSPRATMKHGCVILARESIVYRRGSSESGRKGIAHKQATEGSVWLLCWFIGMFPQPSWSCHYPNVGDCMGPYHKFLHSVPAISSSWSSCHLASSLSASCVNIANIYHMDTKLFSWANSSQPTHHTSSLAES